MGTLIDFGIYLTALRSYIGRGQMVAIGHAFNTDKRQWAIDKLTDLMNVICAMPKTYETDGTDESAVVHLHYFKDGCDWYITERDILPEQLQAYGLQDLGRGAELGYISIAELLHLGAELDLDWTARSIGEILAEKGGRQAWWTPAAGNYGGSLQ